MTRREKIIVSAYTGFLMCDFADVHQYIEEKLDRMVFTHELADRAVWEEIRAAAKPEFLALCKAEDAESASRWHGPEELPPVSGAEPVDEETDAIYRGPVLAWCRGREWRIAQRVDEESRGAGGYEFHGWLNWPDDGGSVEVLAWRELPEAPEGIPELAAEEDENTDCHTSVRAGSQ